MRRTRRPWLFWLGIALVSYDMLGHLTSLVARLTGTPGAVLWNTSAGSLWPSLANSGASEAYWRGFFALAILCLILGRSHEGGSMCPWCDEENAVICDASDDRRDGQTASVSTVIALVVGL